VSTLFCYSVPSDLQIVITGQRQFVAEADGGSIAGSSWWQLHPANPGRVSALRHMVGTLP
jgi:hypothetical protein